MPPAESRRLEDIRMSRGRFHPPQSFRDRVATGIASEISYTCNTCEEIDIPLDLSQGASQEYFEDCPVCCQTNLIHVEFDDAGNAVVWAEPEQDDE